ncbi:hypothetical protein ACPCSD_32125 [Streptomyces griseoincarnatus]
MPYRPFYPSADVPVVQVAIRGEHIGRRNGVRVPLVETVTDTAGALLQLLREKPAGARAAGIVGVRADRAGELDDALREAFFHDGPAVVDARTASQELSPPPHLTYDEVKGFSLFATRTVLSGEGNELLEPAKTNLHELPLPH